ncbi:MAG: competence/damage-inducible protein A [Candidatus Binatia bacterium]
MPRAVILSTGDELTSGRVVDTNSAYIADKLYGLGFDVAAVLKVGDHRERLLWALASAVSLGEIIIGTGGLGPTSDDLTNEVVAEFLGRRLVLHQGVVEALKQRFAQRKIPWTENNQKQAMLPESAVLVPNPVGTAPGFRVSPEEGKALFWLPGVPREMEAMLHETVLPWLRQSRGSSEQVSSHTFKLHGLTESKLDDLVKDIALPDSARLSFRAHYPDLTLRLSLRGDNIAAQLAELAGEIRKRIGSDVYSEADETLEEIVGRLLVREGRTLAVAESCTGGYISHRITRVAGSSAYYVGGCVSYSNNAKERLLGVERTTLERYGAVSRETALEMAEGVRRRTGAGIALSVTGVAGPSGGTADVPVGTVWMGMAQDASSEARRFRFQGERERVIVGASQTALHWLRSVLIG